MNDVRFAILSFLGTMFLFRKGIRTPHKIHVSLRTILLQADDQALNGLTRANRGVFRGQTYASLTLFGRRPVDRGLERGIWHTGIPVRTGNGKEPRCL